MHLCCFVVCLETKKRNDFSGAKMDRDKGVDEAMCKVDAGLEIVEQAKGRSALGRKGKRARKEELSSTKVAVGISTPGYIIGDF
jgi:hypothetical protein